MRPCGKYIPIKIVITRVQRINNFLKTQRETAMVVDM